MLEDRVAEDGIERIRHERKSLAVITDHTHLREHSSEVSQRLNGECCHALGMGVELLQDVRALVELPIFGAHAKMRARVQSTRDRKRRQRVSRERREMPSAHRPRRRWGDRS